MSQQQNEQQRFIETIKQLGNSAILIHVQKDGKPEAVYISPEYLLMMEEDSQEDATRFNADGDSAKLFTLTIGL